MALYSPSRLRAPALEAVAGGALLGVEPGTPFQIRRPARRQAHRVGPQQGLPQVRQRGHHLVRCSPLPDQAGHVPGPGLEPGLGLARGQGRDEFTRTLRELHHLGVFALVGDPAFGDGTGIVHRHVVEQVEDAGQLFVFTGRGQRGGAQEHQCQERTQHEFPP